MERFQLSAEQECALQQFEQGDNLFVTGPAGTGKTYFIQRCVTIAKANKKNIQVCALTGCAALLLMNCNASTIHSWSGIRLAKGELEEVVLSVLHSKKSLQKWIKTDILVIDEVSMMSSRIFDMLNEIGKRARKNSRPFGGIQIIFTGDFYQLPPVGNGSGEKFCFESLDWYTVFPLENHIELKTIFRQTDPVYQKILTSIRNGQMTLEQIEFLKTYVNRPYDGTGCVPTKLFPTRDKVDYINRTMFDSLEGQCYEFSHVQKTGCQTFLETGTSISSNLLLKCKKELTEKKKEQELESLICNSPCEKTLYLKKGANVMCTSNLDQEAGICNGSIGIIVEFLGKNPVVKFSNGVIRAIPIKYWQSEEYPTLAVGQIPLCLAWAMTIHKIQGATLSMAEMDIGSGIFECGQSYVALSRVKELSGLYLSGFSPEKIRVNEKVRAFYARIPEVEYEVEYEDVKEEEKDVKSISFAHFRCFA